MVTLSIIANFFGFASVLGLFRAGQVDFHTLNGIESLILAIFPILLFVEILFLGFLYRAQRGMFAKAFKIPAAVYIVNTTAALLVNLDVFLPVHRFSAAHALFTVPVSITGFFYAFLVWEFSHFVYHWSAHKVRLLWCLHSPHHAPTHMNLSVIHVSFLLQGAYATFVRISICTLLGVPIELLLLAIAIDSLWGSLIHVSERAWPSGRLPGVLSQAFLSPVHHRVHHASNPEYIDRNYCNTLPIWDRLFGTYQEPIAAVPIRYGITRPMCSDSFGDLYFGEFVALVRDMRNARNWRHALMLPLMPPAWNSMQLSNCQVATDPATPEHR